MHKLRQIKEGVEASHRGLGNMLAFNILAATANQCVLNIAVAGIGKSTCTWTIKEVFKDEVFVLDSITRSGFKYISDELSGFDGVVIVDDLGKVDTQYSRMATVTSFAELCYSHFIRKMTYTIDIEINNFKGAALMNIQPVLMELLTNRPEWEAVIRDKTIRYYHIIRPLSPSFETPDIDLKRKRSLNKVKIPATGSEKYYELVRIGLVQWGYARALEHISELLKATALIDDRILVQEEDMNVLIDVLSPITLERYMLKKFAFESSIHFENDAMCILTELASFNPLSLDTVCQDFKMTAPTAKRILANVKDWCVVTKGDPCMVVPTEYARDVLSQYGIERKKEV